MRKATEKDISSLLKLVIRLKKLNEEFDPLFKVRDDADIEGEKYLRSAISSENCLVVVAEESGRIVGMAKVDIKNRIFYTPAVEGHIVDLYIMPEYRRKALGEKIIGYIISTLKQRVNIITVEFPTANQIAVNFYTKLGFRPVLSHYVRGE